MPEDHSPFRSLGEIDLNTYKIVNVVDPTNDQDAATKKYVDDNATSPAGAAGEVQFTDGAAFDSDPGLKWDNTRKNLGINVGAGTVEAGLHVGAGNPFRATDPTDAYITKDLEVDGTCYFDGIIQQLWNSTLRTGYTIEFKTSSNGAACTSRATHNRDWVWALGETGNRCIVYGELAFFSHNFDHGTQTNPTIFYHDATGPNVSNNKWGSNHHDGEDFIITTGPELGIGATPATINNEIVFAPRGDQKVKITNLGGIAIKLTNNTGFETIQGQIVVSDPGADDSFIRAPADDLEMIGVVLESGVADSAEAWIVIGGIADVAMENNTSATRGYWVRSSITEIGYADSTNSEAPQPISQTHFTEVGHCIETVAATGLGTHILARCVIHFN